MKTEGFVESVQIRPLDPAQIGLVLGGIIGALVQHNDINKVRECVQMFANTDEIWETIEHDLCIANAVLQPLSTAKELHKTLEDKK